MKQLPNYNIFALQGDPEVSDYEVAEQLGVDPKYACTPEFNEQCISKMHQHNVDGFIRAGHDEKDAITMADLQAADTRAKIKSLLATLGQL
jgi:hypothetical protein